MATIQYVTAGAIAGATTAPTITVPAGIQNGDLLLMLCESANQAISVTSPAGWTEVGTQASQAIGTAAGATATRLAVFYKFTTGTETNPVLIDSGQHTLGQILVFRNVNYRNPFIATASGATTVTLTTTFSFPTVTTTVPNSLIFLCCASHLNTTVFNALPTNANLTSITERVDNGNAAGNGGSIAAWTSFKSTAGATGATSAVSATSAIFGYLTIALRPEARRFLVS